MAILKAFSEFDGVETISDVTNARASTHTDLAVSGQNRAAMAIDSNTGASDYAEFSVPHSATLWVHMLFKGAADSGSVPGYLLDIRDENADSVVSLYASDATTLHVRFGGSNVYTLGAVSSVRELDFEIVINDTTGILRVYESGVTPHVYELLGDTKLARTSDFVDHIRWRSLDGTATAGDSYATIISQVILASSSTVGMTLYTVPLVAETVHTDFIGTVSDITGAALNSDPGLSANTDGQTSAFTKDDLPTLPADTTISAVIVSTISHYTTDAVVTKQAGVARVGGTTYENSPVIDLVLNDPSPVQHVFGVNPETSAAWTEAEFDAAYFGFRAKT